VQEEATKLSKRAQRRAAGEGSEEATDAELAEEQTAAEADGDAAPEEGVKDETASAPNRQARRTAAAQARARRKREREAASAIGLDAAEMVDDALVRFTDKATRLLRRNWNAIQWVLGLGIIGWFGYQVYAWRRAATNAETSDVLYAAVAVERGRTGDPAEQGKPNANGIIDPTPIFENDAARLATASRRYGEVVEKTSDGPAAEFARIGQAGVLLEQDKPDEALALFEQVAKSPSAEKSPELRGGAIEGRGLSLEDKGDLAGALAAFEALGNVPGFENRALYQQARIKHQQGDDTASKALLTKLFTNLGPPKAASLGGLPERPDFLRQRATALANAVDPLEKDVKIPKPPLGADAVQQMLEQLKEQGIVAPPTPTENP
jgi:predicted negative regulator of RcsB-dependent stress response